MKRLSACLLAFTLLVTPALGESLMYDGVVAASTQVAAVTPVGGTVQSVSVAAGDSVTAGQTLATFETEKVYATQDGVVGAIFADVGDDLDDVVTRQTAVIYLEPAARYTISATTNRAYDSMETEFIHVGEAVYLSCYTDGGDHTGTGWVTAVSGSSYTVEVLTGDFELGETVSIFRDEEYTTSQRLGRGTLSRKDPVAVTGTGTMVALHVAPGDTVTAGQLLFESLTGDAAGMRAPGAHVESPSDGVVASVAISAGDAVEAGAAVVTLYPEGSLVAEVEIPQSDLDKIAVGSVMQLEFPWNETGDELVQGQVTAISRVPTETETGEVTYTATVSFEAGENVRVGMSVTGVVETAE